MLSKTLFNARRSTAIMGATPSRGFAFFGGEDDVLTRSDRKTGRKMRIGPFCIVGEKFSVLTHRFQKFHKELSPGLNFLIPFIDTVEYTIDLREQLINIHSQVAVTKDNVALHIDGCLYIQVDDPYKAAYNVEDYEAAIVNLAQTTMRSEIGKLRLDETFVEREALNVKIVGGVQNECENWGIKALRYEIKDIDPPNTIQNSMILQAEAERKKRASILTSEGDKEASINRAKAERERQILLAEGLAEAAIAQASAQGQALNLINEKLETPGGRLAAQFLLGQRYIDSFEMQARKENILITNSNPQDVRAQINDSLSMLKN